MLGEWSALGAEGKSFLKLHLSSGSLQLVAHSLAALGAKLSPGTDPIQDSILPCICVLVIKDLVSGTTSDMVFRCG